MHVHVHTSMELHICEACFAATATSYEVWLCFRGGIVSKIRNEGENQERNKASTLYLK